MDISFFKWRYPQVGFANLWLFGIHERRRRRTETGSKKKKPPLEKAVVFAIPISFYNSLVLSLFT
jgi:hypothetical protein